MRGVVAVERGGFLRGSGVGCVVKALWILGDVTTCRWGV